LVVAVCLRHKVGDVRFWHLADISLCSADVCFGV
jgi:hypothetical protein